MSIPCALWMLHATVVKSSGIELCWNIMVLHGVAEITSNLTIFGLVILSITEKKILKSPIMIVIFFSPFSLAYIFWTSFIKCTHICNCCVFLKKFPGFCYEISLYIFSNAPCLKVYINTLFINSISCIYLHTHIFMPLCVYIYLSIIYIALFLL